MTSFPLPETSQQFIAYTKRSIDSADADGQAQRFRSQVWVREIPSVLVKSANTKTVNLPSGTSVQTTSFTFDAASIGIGSFQYDFSASLTANDPAHALLMAAQRGQLPVYVALETVRRNKNTKTGEAISPATPISELRGADQHGQHADNSITKANTKNLIAAVAPSGHSDQVIVTSECVSDPSEWEQLRSNRDGSFSPSGWRPVPGGVTNAPTGQQATPVDVDALAAEVAAKIGSGAAVGAAQRPAAPARSRGQVSSVEGKAWEAHNSDGTLNAGSDLMSKYRAQYTYSVRKLIDTGRVDDLVADAHRLTRTMLWMADQVAMRQEAQRRLPRLYRSHFEASMWVQTVIDHVSAAPSMSSYRFEPGLLDDRDAMCAWAKAVSQLAGELFVAAQTETSTYLDPDAPQQPQQAAQGHPGAQQPQQAAQQQPQQAAQGHPGAQQPQQAAQGHPGAQQQAPASDPWAAADPIAAAGDAPLPADQSAASLQSSWHELLDLTVSHGSRYEDRFLPLVRQTFGTDDMTRIGRDPFAAQIKVWSSDRPRFFEAAKQAALSA